MLLKQRYGCDPLEWNADDFEDAWRGYLLLDFMLKPKSQAEIMGLLAQQNREEMEAAQKLAPED